MNGTNDKKRDNVNPPQTETTPLLGHVQTQKDASDRRPSSASTSWFKPIYRVLLSGFLVSMSFGVTQVPFVTPTSTPYKHLPTLLTFPRRLIYVFRLMTCQAYYESHPGTAPSSPIHDRCSLPEIEAGTARAISLLGCSTTFFGVANLFITGRLIKRFGVKSALGVQVFWPAARLAVQNVGVLVGGSAGIVIVQCSQIMTIVGGPVGYM